MLKIKATGPWKRLSLMLHGYGERVRCVERRIGVGVVEALLARVKELSPSGDEYARYIESLEAVELTGGGRLFFGVVSRRDKVGVGDLLGDPGVEKTVVYISPSAGGVASSLVESLSLVNPWPVDLLPGGLPDDVSLVHRLVSVGEMDFVRERVKKFIAQNRAELRGMGLKIENVVAEDVENMSSLPDYMWVALRTEFGINAESKPHWRPAVQWVIRTIQEAVDRDDKIRDALRDPLFREHTFSKGDGLGQMSADVFKGEVSEFQRKVLG